MSDYSDENARERNSGQSHWLSQLAKDMSELRKEMSEVKVGMGKLETRQSAVESAVVALSATVTALQKEGRAETYIDTRAILQALGMALALLAIMGGIYWIGRL